MFPQSTVLDPLFWMILGALQVFIFKSAKVWAEDYQLRMNGWKWSLAGGWWFSFILTIAGAFTLLAENEGNAGWYFLGFVGTAIIVGGAVLLKILLVLSDREKLTQQ
ncbi:hypothetical protein [Photobacterium sp. OFAV2-7]|uniref:hypothetical protein n=1 Tax=Photobacterium sp. OFAV2-7 TaxID=2917748 RepID=UPI001EF6AC5E|nr:hypothetical protein [Photobacterium sp. OFAV2-7]MCG7588013.1 hypothetical protein [Photobacterium sp. OFAV2-7]